MLQASIAITVKCSNKTRRAYIATIFKNESNKDETNQEAMREGVKKEVQSDKKLMRKI